MPGCSASWVGTEASSALVVSGVKRWILLLAISADLKAAEARSASARLLKTPTTGVMETLLWFKPGGLIQAPQFCIVRFSYISHKQNATAGSAAESGLSRRLNMLKSWTRRREFIRADRRNDFPALQVH
jgi:hypothetical protein